MTIRKGEEWGVDVTRPDGLVVAPDDAALATLLDSGAPAAVSGGDLFRTLGGRAIGAREEMRAVTLDLLDVSLDGQRSGVACAHVVARSPARRGGWLRGRALLVMNAEFLGPWDVAPRGHPNDGRAECLEVAASMPPRARLTAARRARSAAHLPHPDITTRSVRAGEWTFDRPMAVRIDGRSAGSAQRVEIAVRPDAATLYV